MEKIVEYCKTIVQNLVTRNFQALESCGALYRCTKNDILRVISEYGGTLTEIPKEAYETNAIEIYKYNDNSGYGVDIDLWVDGQKSDLTLQLDI